MFHVTYVAHLQGNPALLVRLNEAAMRILDGLATLSESEAKQVKPQQEEPDSKSVISCPMLARSMTMGTPSK